MNDRHQQDARLTVEIVFSGVSCTPSGASSGGRAHARGEGVRKWRSAAGGGRVL